MQELFERISDVQGDKVTEISLSYLEIYNETIRDLLEPATDGKKGGLMLREDANEAVSVAGLSSHHPQNVVIEVPPKENLLTHPVGTGSHGYDSTRKRITHDVSNGSKCNLLKIPCRTTN